MYLVIDKNGSFATIKSTELTSRSFRIIEKYSTNTDLITSKKDHPHG